MELISSYHSGPWVVKMLIMFEERKARFDGENWLEQPDVMAPALTSHA